MKIFSNILLLTVIISACETIVDVKVNEVDPYLVVDAWLTHEPGEQVIRLTTTQSYYDNTFAPGVTDADVKVSGDSVEFNFENQGDGNYVLTHADTFGVVGQKYTLEITWRGDTYTATAEMPRGASIDSIRYTYEEASGFAPAYYYSEFFGHDPVGEGDAYWLKAWKNGNYLNKPSEIYLFYDASFSEGNGDGIPFIFPIRTFANPFEQDINVNVIPPYTLGDTIKAKSSGRFKLNDSEVEVEGNELVVINEGDRFKGGISSYPLDGNPYYLIDENTLGKNPDSVYLELHAISPDAWFFLFRLQQESNRPEGFGALFATPPADLPTNITCDNEDVSVAGFFNLANVNRAGQKITREVILEK